MKYYFFHVENSEDIIRGEKPRLLEIGPYVYKEKRFKRNIVQIGMEELFYSTWIQYTFDLEQTKTQGCWNFLTNDSCTERYAIVLIVTENAYYYISM